MIECIKNMLFIPKSSLLHGYSIYLFIFIGYLELSPSLGNMWLRSDSMGVKRFHPQTIGKILLKPLISLEYWNPLIWDINFYLGGFLFSKTLYYFKLI